MKWFKRLILAFAVLIALLAAVPLLVSLDDYRPQIEKMVSEKLKEPVSLKKLRLIGLPLPHIKVEGIAVGKATDLSIGAVSVTPDLFSLLTSTKVIRSVDIEGLVITQRALDMLPEWAKSDPKAEPAAFKVLVQSISLKDSTLKLQHTKFGPFDALVSIDENGVPERADITARDGKFKASLTPAGEKFNVEVNARDWRLPAGPPIHFESLQVSGVASPTDADFKNIQAKLYGGSIAGKMVVGWQKGLQLKGNFAVDNVELRELVPLFSPKTRLSGRLTAKPVFSGAASKPDQLASMMKLDTPFDIRNGVLQGVDIQEAAMNPARKGGGGETRFDTLSGQFAMDRGTQRLTGLKVSSGSLAADGNVTIAPDKSLSGRVNAKVSVVGQTGVSVPLNVLGTLGSPLVLPAVGAIAGAGISAGASVGAKVGNWASGLFGGGDSKDAKNK
jgi:uncharacterized protein involved in outer membrane biogenesis